jgi:DNA polymerase V
MARRAAGTSLCSPHGGEGRMRVPSPADDYLDRALGFNELMIENAADTFTVRVEGDSMIGAGILPCDIAVVNRARSPVDN